MYRCRGCWIKVTEFIPVTDRATSELAQFTVPTVTSNRENSCAIVLPHRALAILALYLRCCQALIIKPSGHLGQTRKVPSEWTSASLFSNMTNVPFPSPPSTIVGAKSSSRGSSSFTNLVRHPSKSQPPHRQAQPFLQPISISVRPCPPTPTSSSFL